MQDPKVECATPDDVSELMALLRLMHEEKGLAPWDETKVMGALRDGIGWKQGMIGVIRGPKMIEASIALFISSWWYSQAEHITDLWSFVHPDHRKSTHAKKLIEFAKEAATDLKRPLLMGVLNTEKTSAKVRLFRRQMPEAGSLFIFNGTLPDPIVVPSVV